MKVLSRIQKGLTALAAAATLATMASGAWAQPPGGGGMPPEIQAKIKAWTKWREQNKNLSNLQTMLMQVREMDKDSGTQLDKQQAVKLLAIMKAWRNKPTMTDDQAKGVSKDIGGMLNVKQLKKMSTIQNPWQRGGSGGGGGARPGGAGGFKFPDPPKGGYNPFNPDTLPFEQMRPMAKKSSEEFMAALASRK